MRSRTCSKPGCYGVIRADVCSQCGPLTYHNWKGDHMRGTRQERGYDERWLRLRKRFVDHRIQQAMMDGQPFPVCELCSDWITEVPDVDHIMPFDGIDDPRRLAWTNLRIVHRRCHMRHTGEHGNRVKAGVGVNVAGG